MPWAGAGAEKVSGGGRGDAAARDLDQYAVLTPERVGLQYDIAGLGSRAAAALVDTLLQGFVFAILIAALVAAIAFGQSFLRDLPRSVTETLTALMVAGTLLAFFLVTWGYFIAFEIAWSGQTPGKRLVGLRVIRENGYPLRASDAIVRNLIRVVEGQVTGYALAGAVMLLNNRAKRLGDFAAGTIVVREGAKRSLASLSDLTVRVETEATRGSGVGVDADEASLVRDFLLRRNGMERGARAALAARLAESLARRYGREHDRAAVADDEAFLERLVETTAATR